MQNNNIICQSSAYISQNSMLLGASENLDWIKLSFKILNFSSSNI